MKFATRHYSKLFLLLLFLFVYLILEYRMTKKTNISLSDPPEFKLIKDTNFPNFIIHETTTYNNYYNKTNTINTNNADADGRFKSREQSSANSSSVEIKKPPLHSNSTLLTQGGADQNKSVRDQRDFIQHMMTDAWGEYVRYAWGQNVLCPISRRGSVEPATSGYTVMGATIIDSLSTLYIMGFHEEFKRARDWIESNFHFGLTYSHVSLFETNIRIVGGLLSAFALSSDKLFLDKAVEVAKLLLPAFDTEFGIPMSSVNPSMGSMQGDFSKTTISLAAMGTLHLEFVYLSSLTNDSVFEDKVERIRRHLYDRRDAFGFYKYKMKIKTGEFISRQVSIGASSDSFYEYLLKSWIQTGDEFAWKMYADAMDAMVQNGMMLTSPKSNLLYFGKRLSGYATDHIFSHLACFAGGMFALGSSSSPVSYKYKERDLDIGKNVTHTCHESYVRSKTGLGPEFISMQYYSEAKKYAVGDGQAAYILRPEVIESYFILYRITKNPKYREWGWEAALAIEKHCKAGPGRGYSGILNVDVENPVQDDVQQTFFLAETLKDFIRSQAGPQTQTAPNRCAMTLFVDDP